MQVRKQQLELDMELSIIIQAVLERIQVDSCEQGELNRVDSI